MEIKVAMPDNCKMPRVLQRIQETGMNLLVILRVPRTTASAWTGQGAMALRKLS